MLVTWAANQCPLEDLCAPFTGHLGGPIALAFGTNGLWCSEARCREQLLTALPWLRFCASRERDTRGEAGTTPSLSSPACSFAPVPETWSASLESLEVAVLRGGGVGRFRGSDRGVACQLRQAVGGDTMVAGNTSNPAPFCSQKAGPHSACPGLTRVGGFLGEGDGEPRTRQEHLLTLRSETAHACSWT